ncbi:MAG: hypothetical protein M3O61_09535 [Gemmatimonadota bacterium]|nr:hypothetical protein [Gemmatimonadota bacterium]
MAEKMIITLRPIRSKRFELSLVLTVVAMFVAPGLSAQAASPCVDPSSGRAQALKHRVGVLVSQSDTVSANERTRFSLPLVAANQVTIISDTTVCRTASLAYDAAASTVPIDRPVVVLALGTQRLVIKDYRFGEWLLAVLFNQTYTVMVKRFGL